MRIKDVQGLAQLSVPEKILFKNRVGLAIMQLNGQYFRMARKPRLHFLVKTDQESPKEE